MCLRNTTINQQNALTSIIVVKKFVCADVKDQTNIGNFLHQVLMAFLSMEICSGYSLEFKQILHND